jgi:hypothetical protein
MHKLPDNFDPECFLTHTLEMICCNQNQVYFHFSDRLSLCAEIAFEFFMDAGTIAVPLDEVVVLRMLGSTVTEVYVDNFSDLTLVFDQKKRLRFTSAPQYESYRIKNGSHEIIV